MQAHAIPFDRGDLERDVFHGDTGTGGERLIRERTEKSSIVSVPFMRHDDAHCSGNDRYRN
jgi:hypothetical protein